MYSVVVMTFRKAGLKVKNQLQLRIWTVFIFLNAGLVHRPSPRAEIQPVTNGDTTYFLPLLCRKCQPMSCNASPTMLQLFQRARAKLTLS